MPIINLIGNRGRENPSHAKFRTQLEGAIRSVTPAARVDPAVVDGMLALIRSKEVSPGDALSCFKTHLREGTPDEQFNTLRVLIQFVDADPHLANILHLELASKRWRDRFVILAGSPHPEVRPLLVVTLQTWAASYRANDIGMHYQSTLRDLTSAGGSFRGAGGGYSPQYTGYSAQQTGYSAQATGGFPRPPGYPMTVPAGYPAPPPGYPPYGTPPYSPQSQPLSPSRRIPETVPQKLEQLVIEVEVLRGAIRSFETTLADYKAQRCNFAALSAAMEKGQRSADRCSTLQTQMESLLGTTDADEALMNRIFSTNDAAVAALEQWGRLANQELAPDDAAATASAVAASSSAAAARASASGAAGSSAAPPLPPLPPARPPPSPLDLLLGDELPAPMPLLLPPPQPAGNPAAPSGTATGSGTHDWNAFSAPPPAGAYPVVGVGAAAAHGSRASMGGNSATLLPVVPAGDIEGLRAQVLALAAELEKERKTHKTTMDAQEAFHKQELERVRVQAQVRTTELEVALALARQAAFQPMAHAGPSAGQIGTFGSGGGAAPPPAAPPLMPAGLSSNNPFAPAFSTTPSFMSMPPPPIIGTAGAAYPAMCLPQTSTGGAVPAAASSSAAGPVAAPPPAVPPLAAPPAASPAPDFFSAFDDLAVLPRKSGGGAPAAFGSSTAGNRKGAASASAAGPSSGASWVNFGH